MMIIVVLLIGFTAQSKSRTIPQSRRARHYLRRILVQPNAHNLLSLNNFTLDTPFLLT